MISASTAPSGSQGASGVRVTVRYWAAARAAAGVTSEELCGASVADVLVAAQQRHQEPRFAQVLSVCSLLLGDRPLGTSDLARVEVADGDVLDVLPPFAGG